MNYKIKISPGSIYSDIVQKQYSGNTFGVYTGMTSLLKGGANNISILTGLSINILLTQTIKDLGYYTPFDGLAEQANNVSNFVFSSTTEQPYIFHVFNTSEPFNKFLQSSTYVLDWGDGSNPISVNESFVPISHEYPEANNAYEIKLTQTNAWGTNIVTKKIKTPYILSENENPYGTIEFNSFNGNWSATPISYNYIFSGDSENYKSAQVYNKPVLVSGVTKSRLEELSLYGNEKYIVGVPIIKYGDIYGMVDDIGESYTGYTIQGIKYFDYVEGLTIFLEEYNSFTEDDIVAVPITKDENMLDMVDQPQIQTSVFIERGVISPYEKINRLGEVSNMLDLENYGYGFFNLTNKQ